MSKQMTPAVERQIDDLNEQIEEAITAGRRGEAEELYMEVENICSEYY
jgi:hypothetical protein